MLIIVGIITIILCYCYFSNVNCLEKTTVPVVQPPSVQDNETSNSVCEWTQSIIMCIILLDLFPQ